MSSIRAAKGGVDNETAGGNGMSSSSGTSPATRRIARSYLTDLVAAVPWPDEAVIPYSVMPVVDQLLDRAIQVRHVLRSDQLVLTFDLADDPANWATTKPADVQPASHVDDGAHTRIPDL